MDKIRKMSIFLKYAFLIMLLVIPVYEILGWVMFDGSYESYFMPEFLMDADPDFFGPLTDMQRVVGIIASAPYMLLGMYCTWQLVKLFNLYSQGFIFTAKNSVCYRHAAWALLIGEVIYPFTQMAVTFVATMHNEVGERMIAISFDDANIGNIVVACVILAISWVMDEGRKLQDEAELTI